MKLADKIVLRPIDALIPYASNARTHSDAQIAQIAASIREFGFTTPVLIDGEQGIIAGHGRVLAARKLGMAQIPTIELGYLSEAQRKAYVIADNKLAENAGWDTEMLSLELGDLKELSFDLSLTGFGELELTSLLADKTEGLTDPDEAPPLPEHPVSQLGDLWILGRHRIICGDSTVATDVERVLAGVEPQMVFADPPYGMNLDTNYKRTILVHGNSYARVIGDDKRFDPSWILERFRAAEEIFLWGADYYCASLPTGGSWIVWDKKKDDLDASIGSGFELCWSRLPHKRLIARFLWSGFTAKERGEPRAHPTQKPVALCCWFLDQWGKTTSIVADPYCGSGTTIIAAEMTGRSCHAIELSPQYIDVAIKRWQDFAGKQALLDGDGLSFREISAQRNPQNASA